MAFRSTRRTKRAHGSLRWPRSPRMRDADGSSRSIRPGSPSRRLTLSARRSRGRRRSPRGWGPSPDSSTTPSRSTKRQCAPRSPPRPPTIRPGAGSCVISTTTRAARLRSSPHCSRGELTGKDGDALRVALEQVLADEIAGELRTIAAAFPKHLGPELATLQRHAAHYADGTTRVAPLAAALLACADAGGVPPATAETRDAWSGLASWLLVANDDRFRKKVDVNDGFPPGGAVGREAALRTERCAAMNAMLAELAAMPGLATQLDLARRLPPPRYSDDAWALVIALKEVLPELATELMLAFRDAGELDFVQGTIAAIEALGADLAPSDLLLKLDARIDHLLIDEFQDTSFTQLALLRLLTAGWAPGDGRTVFAVGDPMQSIYRFREAEVRIFVEAQAAKSVAEVPVETLRLERNFRSHAGLVGWVNATFAHVLGRRNDPWRGAVAFAPARAAQPALANAPVTLEVAESAAAEALRVVAHVRAALEAGPGTVAILVRARAHLDCVLPALRAAGIAYAAVELDALAERQAILDLESLTHALAQPADRLAWLSVLRAPWCGLALADLFAVAAAAEMQPSKSIAALMDAPHAIAGLSEDGAARWFSAAQVLRPALAARGRGSLVARVRGAWLALGAPALLVEAIDVAAAERFFVLLAGHERAGDLPDWAAFVAALRELYAAPQDEATARVQVMTLHRAKGLEFDTVILPGLARRTSGRDAELLRLRIRERGPLVGPSRARHPRCRRGSSRARAAPLRRQHPREDKAAFDDATRHPRHRGTAGMGAGAARFGARPLRGRDRSHDAAAAAGANRGAVLDVSGASARSRRHRLATRNAEPRSSGVVARSDHGNAAVRLGARDGAPRRCRRTPLAGSNRPRGSCSMERSAGCLRHPALPRGACRAGRRGRRARRCGERCRGGSGRATREARRR